MYGFNRHREGSCRTSRQNRSMYLSRRRAVVGVRGPGSVSNRTPWERKISRIEKKVG